MTDESSAPEARPPTIPDPLKMELFGFESDEAANRLATFLQAYLAVISHQIDLTRLDAVTVAYDYGTALANVDRGIDGFARLTATSTEFATGVAMTPAVLRDGVIKSHMVLNANFVRGIEQDEPFKYYILYVLAHECGHVHDLKVRDEAFPNALFQKRYTNVRQSTFGQIAIVCWDEYAACYLSAPYSNDQVLENLSNVFVDTSRDARTRANNSIKQYRTHRDLQRLIDEVKHEYGSVLKFASYLLGHLHGLGKTISDCDEANNFISGHWCEAFIFRLDAALSSLMARYGQWTDISVFNVLDDIADDLFKDGGIFITETSADSAYVDVPFTPQTMPA
jgi:hypothetical protein